MKIMENELKEIITDFVDYLLPDLTPNETSMYLMLFRKSFLNNEFNKVRIGKRTLADFYGKGSRGDKTNYSNISKIIKGLEEKGCLIIGDTTRIGTSYTILLPNNIPIVFEKKAFNNKTKQEEDYFTNYEKRQEVFKRDNWICFYCGEKVTSVNATLDHFLPQHLEGNHSKENLKTSCLTCNSIKSGKLFDEAAPFILKSIQERRSRKLKK